MYNLIAQNPTRKRDNYTPMRDRNQVVLIASKCWSRTLLISFGTSLSITPSTWCQFVSPKLIKKHINRQKNDYPYFDDKKTIAFRRFEKNVKTGYLCTSKQPLWIRLEFSKPLILSHFRCKKKRTVIVSIIPLLFGCRGRIWMGDLRVISTFVPFSGTNMTTLKVK